MGFFSGAKKALDIVGGVKDIIDQVVTDKDLKNQLNAKLDSEANELEGKRIDQDTTVINRSADVVQTEAKGDGWLQRNWRPLLMLWFAGLIGAHWFGFTPENMSESEILAVFAILKLGIGGYIVGRSAEKVTKSANDIVKRLKG